MCLPDAFGQGMRPSSPQQALSSSEGLQRRRSVMPTHRRTWDDCSSKIQAPKKNCDPAPAGLSDKGGHFAAWEQPELFASEFRAAFKSLR